MKDLITEARELIEALHAGEYDDEYIGTDAYLMLDELCDALEKAEAEARALGDCNRKLKEQNRRLIWRNWVPVTEGLPEERQHENGEPIEFNVIISGAKVPTTLCFDGAEWRDFWKDGGYGPAYAVTHWMPLPAPPKEGAEK